MFDPIYLAWLTLWTSIGSYGLYLIVSKNKTASLFYVYGKSLNLKNRKNVFWSLFLVPKKYFSHFYMSASIFFLFSYAIIFIYYSPKTLNVQLKETMFSINDNLSKLPLKFETVKSLESITSLFFTVILMTVQSFRRLSESLFISVYASNSKINLIHYTFGHLFYMLTALSTLTPILLSKTSNNYSFMAILDNLLSKHRAFIFVLFIYASLHQHKCHNILANLRKDKTGHVITERHFVPSGGLFEYVSCPHYLLEVILYFIILVGQRFENTYWNLAFLLVISTQTINAVTEHSWYKKEYKEYPKQRKAIFPYIL